MILGPSLARSVAGDIVKQCLVRYYRYAGRLARLDSSHPTKKILHWRCQGWRESNRSLHHSNPTKVLHRVSGAQKSQWEELIYSFAKAIGWESWWEEAQERANWKKHEDVEFAVLHATPNIKMLQSKVPPCVLGALHNKVIMAWCNAWTSKRRFQNRGYCCPLCSATALQDSIEHLSCCAAQLQTPESGLKLCFLVGVWG